MAGNITAGIITTSTMQPVDESLQVPDEAPPIKAKSDQVAYQCQLGVFNTTLPSGKKISFISGYYATSKEDEIAWLEHFVETGQLSKV